MELDLLSLDSVVRFAEAWNSRLGPLHVLINNAGIFSIGGWFLMNELILLLLLLLLFIYLFNFVLSCDLAMNSLFENRVLPMDSFSLMRILHNNKVFRRIILV